MSGWARVRTLVVEETGDLDVRYLSARALMALLPDGTFARLRAVLHRCAGMRIGRGVLVMAPIWFTGGRGAPGRVSIGDACFVNRGCLLDASAPIDIGADVSLGHDVAILTGTHLIGSSERRGGLLQSRPIRVGDGAWIAARAVILAGVTVGEGAIVCAGAVVTRSVAPNVMVAGVPAREIRRLAHDG